MKQVKQYRFTGKHLDEKLTVQNLTGINNNGVIDTRLLYFSNKNITSIGIQALPGTKLYVNNANDPIIVGLTGIFEIKNSSKITIYQIRFDKNSINIIKDNPSAILIIDTIEEDGDEL